MTRHLRAELSAYADRLVRHEGAVRNSRGMWGTRLVTWLEYIDPVYTRHGRRFSR